jgi:Family of unknown function (DUF5684)
MVTTFVYYLTLFSLVMTFIGVTLKLISLCKLFDKAGEQGWKAIVPIYNFIVFLKIVGKPVWWAIFYSFVLLYSIYSVSISLSSFHYLADGDYLGYAVAQQSTMPVYYLGLLGEVAAYVFIVWGMNMLSKSFGKSEGFTVGLFFLGFIFYPILAFGKSEYQGPYGDPEAFAAFQKGAQFDFDQEKLHR